MTHFALALAAVLLAAGVLAAQPAHAASIKGCGDHSSQFAYTVTTKAVACTAAKRVVRG